MRKKIWMSWSTGKDSAYALQKLRQSNEYDVVGLLTTITADYDRVSMHAIRKQLLEKQAEALGLPLYPVYIPSHCTNAIYELRMQEMMNQATTMGIKHVAFGDLFLDDIRKYRESKLATIGIQPLFPLWGQDTTLLAHEIIDAGIKAVITCVDPARLDRSFAGRLFDRDLLNDMPANVDPCAEHGEFHTFVYDGPMFNHSIEIHLGVTLERDGYIFTDIIPAYI